MPGPATPRHLDELIAVADIGRPAHASLSGTRRRLQRPPAQGTPDIASSACQVCQTRPGRCPQLDDQQSVIDALLAL
jgi:hypothetical protein